MKIIYWLAIGIFSLNAAAETGKVKHLEPANWWVGMKYNQVELMVQGDNIGKTHPQFSYAGVDLVSVEAGENPNYLYIIIKISDAAKPGKFPIRFMNNDQLQDTYSYELKARAKNSALRQGFNSSDAIYLITPDRFANGDKHNDAAPGLFEQPNRSISSGRHGGDIAGMTQQLDYIAAMGFTQIWPNPLTENNQPEYSYHGYAVTDLYKIDARYGTNKEFQNFVARAKVKKIGVIQDIVLNHIGSKHWWLADLPAADWLNYPDKYTETTHRRTVIQDPYATAEDKKRFTDGWFVTTMPDLNQRNPHLARYLIQNTLWWIEYAGLSGVREDTYGYADEEFLSRWAKVVMDEYPNFNMVGEEWSSNPAIVAHWQKDKQNASGHKPFIPSMMDFPIHDALRAALLEDESFGTGVIKLYETLSNDFIYPDPFNLVIFPENHDTSRIYSYLNEDLGRFKMAMVYMSTMRGIPQFFYGSEVLMTSPRERDDGAVRADMPGGWAGDQKNAFTGKGLSAREKDAQSYIKKLLNWRKGSKVIAKGRLQHFVPEAGVYVYFRYLDDAAVMVVLNKNKEPSSLDLTRFASRLAGKKNAVDIFTEKKVDITKPLNLPANNALVIELH